nr:uncharacterized protein LOC104089099 [Ipomoea batatas]
MGSSSSTFSIFIVVLISLTLASTATATTYRIELSNETPVEFNLECIAEGENMPPATLAPSATATWNNSFSDSDCSVYNYTQTYYGFFHLFNENDYGTQCGQNGNVCSWHLRPDGNYLLVQGKVFTIRGWTLHPPPLQ